MRTEYRVSVVSNPNPSEEVIKKIHEVAQDVGIPVDELLAPELNFFLDESGYNIWFTTMVSYDPTFTLAVHFWSRGEYYVSRAGDSYLVQKVTVA